LFGGLYVYIQFMIQYELMIHSLSDNKAEIIVALHRFLIEQYTRKLLRNKSLHNTKKKKLKKKSQLLKKLLIINHIRFEQEI